MSYDDVDIDTIGGIAYKILLGLITKNEAVDRIKNVKLSKKMDNYDDKKIYVILMSNNKPEAITRQQRYQEKNRER